MKPSDGNIAHFVQFQASLHLPFVFSLMWLSWSLCPFWLCLCVFTYHFDCLLQTKNISSWLCLRIKKLLYDLDLWSSCQPAYCAISVRIWCLWPSTSDALHLPVSTRQTSPSTFDPVFLAFFLTLEHPSPSKSSSPLIWISFLCKTCVTFILSNQCPWIQPL